MHTRLERRDVSPSRGLQPARSVARGLTLVAVLVSVSLAGCYERVVDASGPNAGSANVQRSERSDTWLDRAVFPDKGKEESAFGSSTAERQRAYLRQNKGN